MGSAKKKKKKRCPVFKVPISKDFESLEIVSLT